MRGGLGIARLATLGRLQPGGSESHTGGLGDTTDFAPESGDSAEEIEGPSHSGNHLRRPSLLWPGYSAIDVTVEVFGA